MRPHPALCFALAFLPIIRAVEPVPTWISLFNGHDLAGWNPINVASDTFSARDGLIVCNGRPAGFLVTNRAYENFILELEWRHLTPGGNSGVMIWSSELPAVGAPFPQAIEVQVLDPDYEQGRANAGTHFTAHGDLNGIRGATMTPLGKTAANGRRALPSESRVKPSPDWNHYHIECLDGAITLTVNGAVVTRCQNANPRIGFIALQSEGSEVHFRNIRLQELPRSTTAPLPAASGYRSLFNGLDFRGWQTANANVTRVWSIKDGVIASQAGVPGKDTHLWTEATYRDFDLIADWRMPAKPTLRSRATFTTDGLYVLDAAGNQVRKDILDAGDSGIFYRGSPLHQVNIWSQPMGSGDINELHKDPKLPADLRRAMLPRIPADKPFGDWNRFLIKLRGNRVTVLLNDQQVIFDVPLPDLPANGPIGLQYHRDNLEFRNLYVRPK